MQANSRRFNRLAAALISFTLFSSASFGQAEQGSPDDNAIRGVVRAYLDARRQASPAAVRKLFTSDADQLVSSGEWRKGRDAIVSGTLASSERTGGTRTITVESIRGITRDAAIADGRYEMTGLKGGATRRMWSTFVLVRENGVWRIAAIRNMLPASPAPSSGPK